MTGDMNKFMEFNNCDGRIVRVENNATCHIKGKGLLPLMERLTLMMFILWMV